MTAQEKLQAMEEVLRDLNIDNQQAFDKIVAILYLPEPGHILAADVDGNGALAQLERKNK
jgi:hypothetical protein